MKSNLCKEKNYFKLNTIPLCNVFQYLILIRDLKYCLFKHSLHYYRVFGTQVVRNSYDARFSIKNNINMPQIHSSQYICTFYTNEIKHRSNLPCQLKSDYSKYCLKWNFADIYRICCLCNESFSFMSLLSSLDFLFNFLPKYNS